MLVFQTPEHVGVIPTFFNERYLSTTHDLQIRLSVYSLVLFCSAISCDYDVKEGNGKKTNHATKTY